MRKASLPSRGFSLIETLVVVALFALIGIVVSQSTAVSLQGSRKADASTKVRENLNQAINVMERQLRSAQAIIPPSTCTISGASAQRIDYRDQSGNTGSFRCFTSGSCNAGTNAYVSSPSGSTILRLTNTDTLCITNCQFVCTQPTAFTPPTIDIMLEGRSKEASGAEDTVIRVQTSVNLRAY